MPRVPRYDAPQVRPTALTRPSEYVPRPEGAPVLDALADAAGRVPGMLDREWQRQRAEDVTWAENELLQFKQVVMDDPNTGVLRRQDEGLLASKDDLSAVRRIDDRRRELAEQLSEDTRGAFLLRTERSMLAFQAEMDDHVFRVKRNVTASRLQARKQQAILQMQREVALPPRVDRGVLPEEFRYEGPPGLDTRSIPTLRAEGPPGLGDATEPLQRYFVIEDEVVQNVRALSAGESAEEKQIEEEAFRRQFAVAGIERLIQVEDLESAEALLGLRESLIGADAAETLGGAIRKVRDRRAAAAAVQEVMDASQRPLTTADGGGPLIGVVEEARARDAFAKLNLSPERRALAAGELEKRLAQSQQLFDAEVSTVFRGLFASYNSRRDWDDLNVQHLEWLNRHAPEKYHQLWKLREADVLRWERAAKRQASTAQEKAADRILLNLWEAQPAEARATMDVATFYAENVGTYPELAWASQVGFTRLEALKQGEKERGDDATLRSIDAAAEYALGQQNPADSANKRKSAAVAATAKRIASGIARDKKRALTPEEIMWAGARALQVREEPGFLGIGTRTVPVAADANRAPPPVPVAPMPEPRRPVERVRTGREETPAGAMPAPAVPEQPTAPVPAARPIPVGTVLRVRNRKTGEVFDAEWTGRAWRRK